jgi:uncharacterized glyoxalase superfamily protein PhnB
MQDVPQRAHPNIIPTLRYREAADAIDWLCRAFGFERHMVVEGEDGAIEHAQLTLAGGMIMLGTARDDEFGRLQKPPAEVGGVGTQSPYVIVPDADSVNERAKAAGATIAYDIRDEDYGGRGFSCLDPEGHLWSFGTYDPWAA